MKEVDISCGEYASKWGLTDFYPESEEKLKKVLESGEDFQTEWFGCKKEIRYARYSRCGENFYIEVSTHMDDLYESTDLIYDALWASCKSEKEIPDDIIDNIIEECYDLEITDHTVFKTCIPSETATYEKIIEETESLENSSEENNKEMFERLCEVVKRNVCGDVV